MTAVERLLNTARAEIGYHEKASNSQLDDKTANSGTKNWTKYARDLDKLGTIYNGKKNGYDWCDVFVDWCFITTFGEELGMALLCQQYNGLGAGVKYSAQYYKAQGQFHESGPEPGDQIFFVKRSGGAVTSWQHTGIVERVEGGKLYTIEGNTSGGQVARKSYDIGSASIGGYGRPDWELVPEETEESEEDDMVYYETIDDVPDYYRDAVQKCVDAKALSGVGGGRLHVSEDLCRTLTVLDRLGKL